MGDVDYNTIYTFVAGMIAAGYLGCALFFVKFWVRSRDFLFLAFAVAFGLLALNQLFNAVNPVVIENPQSWPNLYEKQSWAYLLRIAAFCLIAIAIVRKNTGARED